MNTLLRLPFTLLELAARESLKVARGALRLLRPEEHPDDVRMRPIARGEVPRDPVARPDGGGRGGASATGHRTEGPHTARPRAEPQWSRQAPMGGL